VALAPLDFLVLFGLVFIACSATIIFIAITLKASHTLYSFRRLMEVLTRFVENINQELFENHIKQNIENCGNNDNRE